MFCLYSFLRMLCNTVDKLVYFRRSVNTRLNLSHHFVFRNGRFGHKAITDLQKVLNNHSKVSCRRQDLQKTNSYRRVVSKVCTRITCSASQSILYFDMTENKQLVEVPPDCHNIFLTSDIYISSFFLYEYPFKVSLVQMVRGEALMVAKSLKKCQVVNV